MEALEKRRREPTVDPQRTETVSSDSEWLETVSYVCRDCGSLQTVGPAHFKTADEVGKKTPIKRKSSTQNESPPPSTEATRRAHTIITQKERGYVNSVRDRGVEQFCGRHMCIAPGCGRSA